MTSARITRDGGAAWRCAATEPKLQHTEQKTGQLDLSKGSGTLDEAIRLGVSTQRGEGAIFDKLCEEEE